MSWIRPVAPTHPMNIVFALVFTCFLLTGAPQVNGQAINENFANITSLLSTGGWASRNNSFPANPAVVRWAQCTGALIPPAQAGATNTCGMADYRSISPDQAGTISHWLIGPKRTFKNRDTLTFYTKTVAGNPFGDRLQVLLSNSGDSTDVGTSPNDVGVFTTVLMDINPTYTVGVYPEEWTQYTINFSGLSGPINGRFAFRYFIENGGDLGSTGYAVGLDSLVYTPGAAEAEFDYDGDNKTDVSVFRPESGVWDIRLSSNGSDRVETLGIGTDRITPADFDGDGRTDVAVYRPSEGNWYISRSSDGTIETRSWGNATDIPAPGDFDGDGRADLGVFRPGPGEWWIQLSGGGTINGYLFGQAGDVPLVGNFDNDSKDDIAIYRPDGMIVGAPDTSAWLWVRSSDNTGFGVGFGRPTDRIAHADYDADGRMDIAIMRPNGNESGVPTWYILTSSSNYAGVYYEVWGIESDLPAPGDYDGDGKADVAVFRLGTGEWWILQSTGGFIAPQLGQEGNIPTPRAFFSPN